MSGRYDSKELAAAKAPHPQDSFPDEEKSGMSKEQQADMIESINRSAMMNAFHAHHTGASSSHYINADIAAARVPHPANSFPDGDSTGGMTKDEQQRAIEAINRRGVLSASVQHSSASSSHYLDTEVAAAKAPHPEHSYPDAPSAGAGMSKVQQDEMVCSINHRAGHGRVGEGEAAKRSSFSSQRHMDVVAAGATRPDNSYPDSPMSSAGMSKEQQDEMVRSINRLAGAPAIHMQSPPPNASSKFNRAEDVAAAHAQRPAEAFPDGIA